MLYLYLIEATENSGYDTYSGAVVVAHDVEEARSIHPCGGKFEDQFITNSYVTNYWDGVWEKEIEKVKVTQIGVANSEATVGVILASFHAG